MEKPVWLPVIVLAFAFVVGVPSMGFAGAPEVGSAAGGAISLGMPLSDVVLLSYGSVKLRVRIARAVGLLTGMVVGGVAGGVVGGAIGVPVGAFRGAMFGLCLGGFIGDRAGGYVARRYVQNRGVEKANQSSRGVSRGRRTERRLSY